MSKERQEINIKTPWWGEHHHRYEEVIKSLKGDEKILDIASGSGFGSYLLSKKTSSIVYGGDLSNEAIEISKENFTATNLLFQLMDATELPFEDSSFDLIVSFETIEHTVKFKEVLEEFDRVLKPGGRIFLSTPNKKINSPKGILINPFHTQEWYMDEFIDLLDTFYNEYNFFGQKYIRYDEFNRGISYFIERIFYLRGVRKIPLFIKDRLFKLLGFESFYPNSQEYSMISDKEIVKNCKTFFVECRL